MSFALVTLGLAFAVGFFPAWLLRRRNRASAADDLIASVAARPNVARNASIAYALRIAALGPLFVWGAMGEVWPAIIASAAFAAGVGLIRAVRAPLLAYIDTALAAGRPVTVQAFVAEQHGDDPRLGRVAAVLTLCAALGLLLAEALALAAVVAPMLGGSATIAVVLVVAAIVSIVVAAIAGGHSAIIETAQLQLGLLYFGVFGAAVLVLYMHAQARTPLSPHATLALLALIVCSVIVLVYRRSKYVDTDPIRSEASGTGPVPRAARALSRFEKILNVLLSGLLALVIVVAVLDVQAIGWTAAARDGSAALRSASALPAVALIALAVLPLLHPIVDVANWLRIAATRKGVASAEERERRAGALRGGLAMYAAEPALLGLFVCALGAIAAITAMTTATHGGGDAFLAFIAALVAADNAVANAVLALLLIGAFMAAVTTIGALFSSCWVTLCDDLLALREDANTGTRRTRAAAAALGALIVAAFLVACTVLPARVTTSAWVAWVLALASAPLSLAPLVLGPLAARARGRAASVSAGWALAVAALGPASALVAVIVHLATGSEAWLWSAAPLSAALAFAVYAVGRVVSRRGLHRLRS